MESFNLSPQEIDVLLSLKHRTRIFKQELERLGGINGLIEKLKSDFEKGLNLEEGNEENDLDYLARIDYYGRNITPLPEAKSWIYRFFQALSEKTLIILIFVGIISLFIGLAFPRDPESRYYNWIEGFTIFLACFIVSAVTATNEWKKEKQFIELNKNESNLPVIVKRSDISIEIRSNDVVVGDIIILSTGDQIPADGICIESFNLHIDESFLTGESIPIIKNTSGRSYLLSGSLVTEGSGKMLVLSVGERTIMGQTMKRLSEPKEEPPMHQRIQSLVLWINRLAIFFSIITFVILTISWLISKLVENPNSSPFSSSDVSTLLDFIIISIIVLVVTIPEGLPLCITISLSYSVGKMAKENLLVRNLKACEIMASVNVICSDKTGTLTENKMKVVNGYFGSKMYDQDFGIPPLTLLKDLGEGVVQGISVNTTADIGEAEIHEEIEPGFIESLISEPRSQVIVQRKTFGNKTEGALLKLVNDKWKKNYNEIRKNFQIIKRFPFSSKRKSMSTIIQLETNEYILHIKGASEILLDKCNFIHFEDGSVKILTDQEKNMIHNEIDKITDMGMRTMTFAYRNLGNKWLNWDETFENELTFLCFLGIEDPLRPEVKESILNCKKAGVIVVMVTGDHLNTAKKIAKDCGIYESENDITLEGPVFRSLKEDELKIILPYIRILARSSPEDKYILVKAFKNNDNIVAVTGDGTNDAPALKKANVGLAMGSGTSIAKESADIIILDDNFSTIITSCQWGRSVYENIRKFLQFQLTTNISALFIIITTSITANFVSRDIINAIPLSGIQLLWINLIMNSLAALMLSTEHPEPDLLFRNPVQKGEGMITPYMLTAIIAQVIFQVIFSLLIYYVGFFASVTQPMLIYTSLQVNNCILFNFFVWCQMWNLLNSRRIFKNQWNIFKNISKSKMFIIIFLIIITLQIIVVEFGSFHFISKIFQTTSLSYQAWLLCIFLSFLCIPYHFIVVRPIQLLVKSNKKNRKNLQKVQL